MADAGPVTDAFGPYAPYRPIGDLKRTDGLVDLGAGVCFHLLECGRCGGRTLRPVREIPGPEPAR